VTRPGSKNAAVPLVGVSAVALLLLCGWLIGHYGTAVWSVVQRHSVDAYLNKYNAASGADRDSFIYYVVADNAASLKQLAVARQAILDVSDTSYASLFDVELQARERHKLLKEIRGLDGVSAVFTIPFMCH